MITRLVLKQTYTECHNIKWYVIFVNIHPNQILIVKLVEVEKAKCEKQVEGIFENKIEKIEIWIQFKLS